MVDQTCAYTWVVDRLMANRSACPGDVLEEIMADPRCDAFGPVHHFVVGAVLLACWRNAQALSNRDEALRADLEELAVRAKSVPGATCARWGVCGAAASAGMAYAIVRENAPLKAEGWSEGQLVVADLLSAIARLGAPRCCKRDSRVAVKEAIAHFNRLGGAVLEEQATLPICATMHANTACMGPSCPWHPNAR